MLEMIVKVRMSEGDKTKIRHHGDKEAHPLEQTMSIDMSVKREPGCMESLLCESPRYFFIDLVYKNPYIHLFETFKICWQQ